MGGGHDDAGEPLGAERIGGEHRHQRRVDAPGEADQGMLEVVLSRVVAQAEHERRVDLVQVGQRLLDSRALPAELPEQQVLLELSRPGDDLTVCVDDEAVAVEDELVLASDEIAEGEWDPVGARALREHPLAIAALAAQVRRAGWVEDQLGAGVCLQLCRRPRLPHVLADRDRRRWSPATSTTSGSTPGLEVPDLVEDAVVGQAVLAVDRLERAVGSETRPSCAAGRRAGLSGRRSTWSGDGSAKPTTAAMPSASGARRSRAATFSAAKWCLR